MLQITILSMNQRSLYLPTRITDMRIDPTVHLQKVYTLQDETQGSPAMPPARMPTSCLVLPSLTSLSPQWLMW